MATIIDSLIVTLGLDSGDFQKNKSEVDKGIDETAKKSEGGSKKITSANKQSEKSFDDVGKKVLGFLAIIGGTAAIKSFITQMIEANSTLDRFSKNLGTSVETVSAWGNAAELAGGTAEGLRGTMDMLSKSQTELQLTGQSSLIPYFSSLGVAFADAGGKARASDDILLDLASRFEQMDRTKAFNIARMMGIDEGTTNLLLKGRKEVELMIQRQKEYGVLTKQQAEQSSKLREEIVKGKQVFASFGRELLVAVTPAITKLFSALDSITKWIGENKEFIKTFLTILAVGLAAIGLAVIPINATAAAVVALAAGIALLFDDYQAWKEGGEHLIPWDKWKPEIDAAIEALKTLGNVIKFVFDQARLGAKILARLNEGSLDKPWWVSLLPGGGLVGAIGDLEGAKKEARGEFGEKDFNKEFPLPAKPSGDSKSPIDFFVKKGWSREQASGIVANLKAESNLNPQAVGDSGKAVGIAQWHPDRQAEFKRVYGKDIRQATLQEQMEFVNYELTQGNEQSAGKALRGAKTAGEAGAVFSRKFERPLDVEGEAAKRGALASRMFASAPPGVAATQGSSVANNTSSSSVNIGEVKVYTQATDANGIAKDIKSSLNQNLVSQANTGMS